jgi:hypothetical protein
MCLRQEPAEAMDRVGETYLSDRQKHATNKEPSSRHQTHSVCHCDGAAFLAMSQNAASRIP